MPKPKKNPLLDQIAEEASLLDSIPTDDGLAEVSALVKQYVMLLQEKAKAEAEVDRLSAELLKMTRTYLPEAMLNLGMEKIQNEMGVEVKTQEVVRCRLNQADKERGFKWLIDRGLGGIIKRQVTVLPDKENPKHAALLEKLYASLEKYELDYNVKEDVHASTLQAAIRDEVYGLREREANGEKIPAKQRIPDFFNLYVGQEAKVTINKKAKEELGL